MSLTVLFVAGYQVDPRPSKPKQGAIESVVLTPKEDRPPTLQETDVNTVGPLQWVLLNIAPPVLEDLRVCLATEEFRGLKIYGRTKRLIFVKKSLNGTAELKRIAPAQWQLTTPTDQTHLIGSRLHIAITGCLYTEHAEIHDAFLDRTLKGSAWPRLSESGGMVISDLIAFVERDNRLISKGLSRVGYPELEIQKTPDRQKAKQTLKRIISELFNDGFQEKIYTISGFGSVSLTPEANGLRLAVRFEAAKTPDQRPVPAKPDGPPTKMDTLRRADESSKRDVAKYRRSTQHSEKNDPQNRFKPKAVPKQGDIQHTFREAPVNVSPPIFMPAYRDD